MNKANKYTMIDLFSGVGGLSCGFSMEGFIPVFANDFDKGIGESYRLNHPNTKFYHGSIVDLDYKTISKECDIKKNDIDIIFGGPPCQGFSMANRKRIENDERNLLFKEFVRTVDYFRPKCFLIENVIGMKSAGVDNSGKNKKVIDSIHEYFKEIGYEITFKDLIAEEFGVPQFRRRVLIVGTMLKNKQKALKFNEIGNLKKTYLNINEFRNQSSEQGNLFSQSKNDFLQPTTVWDAISDLPQISSGGGKEEMDYTNEPQNKYQKIMRSKSLKIYNHTSTPHAEDVIERLKLIKPGQNYKDLPKELQTKSCHSGAYGRLEPDSLSPTITTRFDTPSTGRVIHPFIHRTLTVREAARIQSFPDHYIFHGTRTSQGKQIGNAVPPLAAQGIAEMIINDFLS